MIRAGLLLAAGASRRFGAGDKLLAEFRGAPLVSYAARALASLQLEHRVAVVSSARVAALVAPLGFDLVHVARGLGQSASLAAGIAAVKAARADQVLIVLGDMPGLSAPELGRLLALAGGQDACASNGTQPMPPAVFRAQAFETMKRISGDKGARELLSQIPPARHLILSATQLKDIDRPGDLLRP